MIPVQHIHPMLVHFPIVLVLLLAVFDLVAAMRGQTVSGRTTAGHISTGLAVLAAVFAIVTMMFGDMALEFAEDRGFSSEIAEIHEHLGQTVAITLSIWALVRAALWWRDARLQGAANALFPVVALAGAGLVMATAYYGGQLVYDLGVNVIKVAAAG